MLYETKLQHTDRATYLRDTIWGAVKTVLRNVYIGINEGNNARYDKASKQKGKLHTEE